MQPPSQARVHKREASMGCLPVAGSRLSTSSPTAGATTCGIVTRRADKKARPAPETVLRPHCAASASNPAGNMNCPPCRTMHTTCVARLDRGAHCAPLSAPLVWVLLQLQQCSTHAPIVPHCKTGRDLPRFTPLHPRKQSPAHAPRDTLATHCTTAPAHRAGPCGPNHKARVQIQHQSKTISRTARRDAEHILEFRSERFRKQPWGRQLLFPPQPQARPAARTLGLVGHLALSL
mmetsp:Transcript_27565/g.71533  ORF Transcript_27565/g.71533 Transcript_27565/m.71533 type:complete len:234 (-) Transcript_27565:223-924(-)